MVVDGRTELASPDIDLARLLLRTGKPLLLAVNKADTPQLEPYAEEFRRLGIKELFPISAENGNGIAELLDHVFERDAGARARRTMQNQARRASAADFAVADELTYRAGEDDLRFRERPRSRSSAARTSASRRC